MITKQIYDQYLSALIAGQRFVCHGIVEDLIQRDISLEELYLGLFQKSMYDVGALWESNRLSVSTEHLATVITESLMTLAYPLLFSHERTGNSAIVACIAHEFHQLGAKMVADFIELAGWDSYFLGGNTPTGDLLSLIEAKKPTILALSLALDSRVAVLKETLTEIRKNFNGLPIVLGGQGLSGNQADFISDFNEVHYLASIEQMNLFLQKMSVA